MFRIATLLITALLVSSLHAQSLDARWKKIMESKAIALAYRTDARPFSFEDERKQSNGFSVEICKRVVASIGRQLNIDNLQVIWVPVTVQTRFDAVINGDADIECGASPVTLSRLRTVDFSSYIFAESLGLMVRTETNFRSLSDMFGKRVGVVSGTTAAHSLASIIERRQLKVAVVPFPSLDVAFAALDDGKVDAVAATKLMLVGASLTTKVPGSHTLLREDLDAEFYGLVLPPRERAFRIAVNTALAHLYADDEIYQIFDRWFWPLGRPSPLLQTLYFVGAIPD